MPSFYGRNFCQVLEGEGDTVTELVDVIRADRRHAGFKVLESKPIEKRKFEGRAMKYVEHLDFSEAVQAMEV